MEKMIKILTNMENQIKDAKDKKINAEAIIKSTMQDLKDQYKIKDSDHLSDEIDNIDDELNKIEDELTEGVAELEKAYGWE